MEIGLIKIPFSSQQFQRLKRDRGRGRGHRIDLWVERAQWSRVEGRESLPGELPSQETGEGLEVMGNQCSSGNQARAQTHCLYVAPYVPYPPSSYPFLQGTADGIPLFQSMSKIFQIFLTLRTHSRRPPLCGPTFPPNNPDIFILLLPELTQTQREIKAPVTVRTLPLS